MNYCKINISEEIANLLSEIKIEQYIVTDEKWRFSVFVSFIDNSQLLEKVWKQVSDVIASSYQTKLKGDENIFEKWNIYIIYVCKECVSKSLKAKIENDKFSNRKIVENNITDFLSEDFVQKIIVKHITNTDLIDKVENTISKIEENYEPNDSDIWNKIPTDKLVSGNLELQKKIIEQLKSCHNEN
jgi:hypothetical protein